MKGSWEITERFSGDERRSQRGRPVVSCDDTVPNMNPTSRQTRTYLRVTVSESSIQSVSVLIGNFLGNLTGIFIRERV